MAAHADGFQVRSSGKGTYEITGEVAEVTTFGPHDAVIPRVSGTSHVTGRNEIFIDPEDPLRHGFILR